jgi:Zn-dependent protease with chaperone function/Tfp pilus assembly protein PilF
MKHIVQGDYYDGHTSVRHPVSMIFAGGKLKVVGADVDVEFDLRRVRRSLRVADTPRWLYLPGGGACVTADNDAIDVIKRVVKYDQLLHRWESRPALAALAVVLVVGFTVGLVWRGLPALAEEIAYRIPVEAETLLGQQALQGLDQVFLGPSQLPPERQRALRDRFAELTKAAGDPTPYRLEFRASKIGPNAFALPAGIIVMLDDLVKLAKRDEEVLGVLAHELGHVHNRHTMRMLLESSATALVIAGLTGDIASTTSLAAAAPALLLQTKYSRDNEREADAYAVELMKKASMDPGSLARILARLDGGAGKKRRGPGLPTFLSTHPATEERKAVALAGKEEEEEEEEQTVAIPEPRLQALYGVQRDVLAMLERGDYGALDARLADLQTRYERGQLGEDELEHAFRAFRRVGASAEQPLKAWGEKMPESYCARVALGIYYLWRGIEARGGGYASETPEAKMEAMQALLARARPELERSIALAPKPYLSHLSMVTLARYAGGERDLGLRHFQEGLRVAPQSVSLRLARMTTLEPRWGGSYRAMEALAQEAKENLKEPLAAERVAARIPAYRANELQRQKKYAEALSLYDEAIRLDPRAGYVFCERSWIQSQLGRHAEAYNDAQEGLLKDREASYCAQRMAWAASRGTDREDVIRMTSYAIEVDPTIAQAYNARGWAQQNLGRNDAAFKDYLEAANLGDAWAQMMVGAALVQGKVVPKNLSEGTEWLKKSAAQGNAEAKRMLEALAKT